MYNLLLGQQSYSRQPKPSSGAQLNWANPLTRQLGFYVNFIDIPRKAGSAGFSVYEHISRTKLFPSSPTLVTSAGNIDQGPAIDFTGAAASRLEWNLSTAPPVVSALFNCFNVLNPFTVGIKIRAISQAASQTICGFNGAGTGRWYLYHIGAGGGFRFDSLDADNADTVGTYNDGNYYTLFGRLIPATTLEIFVFNAAGTFLETVSAALTTNYTLGGAWNFVIGGDTATGAWVGQCEWCAVWPIRLLSLPEMQSLASQPYQIMESVQFKKRWFYSAPPVVSGLTWMTDPDRPRDIYRDSIVVL